LRCSPFVLILGLAILLTLSACHLLPEPSPGDPQRQARVPLWSLLNQVYTGRVPVKKVPRPPFEVLRRVHVVIDAPSQRLSVLVGDQVLEVYPVAVGKKTTPTPIGHWHIKEKGVWAEGFGVRWMGLDVPWGVYGIHGTNKPWSIGTRVSGGCVRMLNRDVVKVFELVSVGTPVTVRGPAFYRYGEVRRTIRPTHIGSDVAMAQRLLKDLGLQRCVSISGCRGSK